MTIQSPPPDTAAEVPPKHVAIIMDGNGRWAKARGLPRGFGHRQGVEAARRAVRAAEAVGIQYLTLYGFSSENWKRPADEVGELMGLLRHFIKSDLADLHAHNVRIKIIGRRENLPPDILALLLEAESRTEGNTGLTLVIAFNYGGQDEIARAARALAEDVAAGRISSEAITPEALAGQLDTSGLPDPDLVIRTSGEQRLSNFLIWQSAYAEFVFLDAYWPDFSEHHLRAALSEFRQRDRRFGALKSANPA